jgi:hypothetical protein
MRVWKLVGARQGRFGVETTRPEEFIQLRESSGFAQLSVEYGRGDELLAIVPDSWSYERVFDFLARLESWGETWAEQRERIAGREDWTPDKSPSWPRYWPIQLPADLARAR